MVKPVFIEANKRKFPGNASLHLSCVIDDDHGEELLHEAITRMPPSLLEENQSQLGELAKNLPDIEAKEIIERLI